MEEEEYDSMLRDENDRKQFHDFKVGNRRSPLSNNVLMLLGDLLQPQTEGFGHINMDMSFSYQDLWGFSSVKNSSFLITFLSMFGFKKAMYLERSTLATHLIASRSIKGKSMDLFTKTVTQQKQEFVDKTDKKTGFDKLFTKRGTQEEG